MGFLNLYNISNLFGFAGRRIQILHLHKNKLMIIRSVVRNKAHVWNFVLFISEDTIYNAELPCFFFVVHTIMLYYFLFSYCAHPAAFGQAREAATTFQGKLVDAQRRKGKGINEFTKRNFGENFEFTVEEISVRVLYDICKISVWSLHLYDSSVR